MNQEYRAIPYVFCCHRDGAASGGCYGPWPRTLCLVGIVYYVGGTLLQQLTTHDSRAEKPLQNLAV